MIHPRTFAEKYVTAWSDGDIKAILAFFDANGELRSPFAKLFVRAGMIKGHSQLQAFCEETLRRRPNMRFELLNTFGGHEAASLLLKDEMGRLTTFTAVFTPSDKIALGVVCYNKSL